jgi:hypothetical protein
MNIFKGIDILWFLSNDQRRQIVEAMVQKIDKAEDVIIKQGDQPEFFSHLHVWTVSVMKGHNGVEKFVAAITSEGFAGELGLISGSHRASTIINGISLFVRI